MSCCPPNAEKYLAATYATTGSTLTLDNGYELYRSGSTSAKNAVLIIPDVYGWHGGRIRNIADWFAEAGYYAVVPKLMVPALEGGTDGDGLFPDFSFTVPEHVSQFPGYMQTVNYPDVLKPRIAAATAHINSCGITSVHQLGFCWGGWVCLLSLADSDFKDKFNCVAIPHPSVSLEQMVCGRPVADLIDRVTKPVLFMPAKGDPDEYRQDGAWYKALKAKFPTSETIDFPEENHGFCSRGDVSIPATKAAVEKALSAALNFFRNHESA